LPRTIDTANLRLTVTPDGAPAPVSYACTLTACSQMCWPARDLCRDIGGLGQWTTGGNRSGKYDAGSASRRHPAGHSDERRFSPHHCRLSPGGFLGPCAEFSADPVALDPGESGTVEPTAEPLDFVLPGTRTFAVTGASPIDPRIRGQEAEQLVPGSRAWQQEVAALSWMPIGQAAIGTLTAHLLLIPTNTGNLKATDHLAPARVDASGDPPVGEKPIRPRGSRNAAGRGAGPWWPCQHPGRCGVVSRCHRQRDDHPHGRR
jgi:hypothetical protein